MSGPRNGPFPAQQPDPGRAIQPATPSSSSSGAPPFGGPGVVIPSRAEHRSARPVVIFLGFAALALSGGVAFMAQPTPCGHHCTRRAAPTPRQIVAVPAPAQAIVEPPAASVEDPLEQALHAAQTAYVNADYAEAVRIAGPLRDTAVSSRAWRVIGGAACQMKDLKQVGEAYNHLDSDSRQFVTYVCHRNGVRSIGKHLVKGAGK